MGIERNARRNGAGEQAGEVAMEKKGIREYGYVIGEGRPGAKNLITDVPGVKVGHCTVETEENKTGVTVIVPCEGLIFEKKPIAAVYALNGFGKTMGGMQIEELGTLETPIALTNTLNVGKVADALISYTCGECKQAGVEVQSINPIVGETNDWRINHITRRAVGEEEVLRALAQADTVFEQGAVGAGAGTVCFGLKGGIGSASREISFGERHYMLGVLVQSNFGEMEDLSVCGDPVGKRIAQKLQVKESEDKGSIMIILATDVPLDSRQLKRVLKRAAVGLIRTGSHMGHGSGDVFIGFTNGNFMPEREEKELIPIQCFPENQMNVLFRAAAEAVEEAVCNSMVYAKETRGVKGEVFHSLREFLEDRK